MFYQLEEGWEHFSIVSAIGWGPEISRAGGEEGKGLAADQQANRARSPKVPCTMRTHIENVYIHCQISLIYHLSTKAQTGGDGKRKAGQEKYWINYVYN